jgi:8-oxo-dGTP pyrophosphatase MutT (NUDIX family)
MCFGLIAAREREIAEEAGVEIRDRPQFTDEINKDNVVSISSLKATLPSKTPNDETE